MTKNKWKEWRVAYVTGQPLPPYPGNYIASPSAASVAKRQERMRREV